MTLDLVKVTQKSPFPLTQCCAKPEKACQSGKTRNEQTNWQPTLNKREGVQVSQFLSMIADPFCR